MESKHCECLDCGEVSEHEIERWYSDDGDQSGWDFTADDVLCPECGADLIDDGPSDESLRRAERTQLGC